ncbi:MAG: DedA family protein [Alphaproteobacteria bacterium]|nr:DedA family protein [Alphaproteobacteria bacterium]
MTELAIYFGLFLNAFVAATLLPAYSEITLAALLAAGEGQPLWLFLAATTGNVAGSVLNWWLGHGIARFRNKKWFPFKEAQYDRAHAFFHRHGKWSLLLAWLPIVGDPLTLVAGAFRVPLPIFLVLVTLGKAARYAIVVLGVQTAVG